MVVEQPIQKIDNFNFPVSPKKDIYIVRGRGKSTSPCRADPAFVPFAKRKSTEKSLLSRSSTPRKGKVYLVGAGPGDPELLTVRAVRTLGQADVVLHDALVSQEVLAMVSPQARILNVGKRCGRKSISQEGINQLLLQFASRGEVVVRLKSGDPLIFGRAGEELDVLREAALTCTLCPG